MRRWRRGGGDAVGSGLWPGSWDVRVGPSSVAWASWINCLTIRRRGACGVPVSVEKKIESEPKLVENLKSVLETHSAGDPEEEDFWCRDFSPAQLAERVADLGTPVSPRVVRDGLADEGLALHHGSGHSARHLRSGPPVWPHQPICNPNE